MWSLSPGLFVAIGIGLAAVCLLWVSRTARKRKQAVKPDDYLDQTCELNYKPEDS
jgi:hypothetical protein